MAKLSKQELREVILADESLSSEVKGQLLDLLKTPTFGLVWEEKTEDVIERLREELPVLNEVKERAIISEDSDAPNHVLIEADNLEALVALTYTHEGKIDIIYIDPPYNTGNKDFVYNDKYVDIEDQYRHSKWLSFMSKRLRLAKQLLSDKGVIFISIDDNEAAQLKLLCDDATLFGEKNFIAKFDWRKKTGANDAKDIAVVTESILLYAKNKENTLVNRIWRRDEGTVDKNRYKYSDEYVETRGKFYYDTLDRGGLQYSDSMNFGIEAPDGGIIYPNGRKSFVNDGWIWKWSKEKIKWGIENKFLAFVKSGKSEGSSYTIKYKVYEKVDNEGKLREKSGRAFSNLITEPINQQGNDEMKRIFEGKTPFSNPKPLGLINYLLGTIYSSTSIILDFFAGSGTTLHSTMMLNNEDGGHRQCFLVTNNENNICEEVTYERNKRVIQGYTSSKGDKIEGLTKNNLRYYRVEHVARKHTHENKMILAKAMTEMLQIKWNAYTEPERFGSLRVKPKYMRYFEGDENVLIIYIPEIIPYLVKEIKALAPEKKLHVYVAADGSYAFYEEFTSVAQHIELAAIPSSYYNAIKSILPAPLEETEKYTPETNDEEILKMADKNDFQD